MIRRQTNFCHNFHETAPQMLYVTLGYREGFRRFDLRVRARETDGAQQNTRGYTMVGTFGVMQMMGVS